ncbi:unnamed protein product [Caenorhabditis nigoni]
MVENSKEVLNLLESLNSKIMSAKAEWENSEEKLEFMRRALKQAMMMAKPTNIKEMAAKIEKINKKRYVERSIEAISALATRNYQQICQKPNLFLKMELEENPLDGVIMSQSDGGVVLAVAERSENSFVIFDNLDNTIFQEHFPLVSEGIHAVSDEVQVIIGSSFKKLQLFIDQSNIKVPFDIYYICSLSFVTIF